MATARAHVMISGRVQGVGYRYSLKHVADAAGVSGWCRNTLAGSVEAVLCGERRAVEEVLFWCRQGPTFAAVDAVSVDWQEVTEPIEGFEIRY